MPVEPPETPWAFPDPTTADGDLVAAGADLEPGTVLAAYRRGLFPMALHDPGWPRRTMAWWSPERRGILPVTGMRVPRSLRQSARRFEIRVDTSFAAVVAGCADPGRSGAWIDEDIVAAYEELHRLGWAHSVEAWQDGELAGGLYGIAVGGLFAGESMFTRVRDASKVALLGLVDLLHDEYADQRLVDTQWQTRHLATLGVVEIPRPEYLQRLERALRLPLPAKWRDAGAASGS